MTTSIEMIDSRIADKERQIAYLEGRHGQGVRPAWVGEEIGILTMQIQDLLHTKTYLTAQGNENAAD